MSLKLKINKVDKLKQDLKQLKIQIRVGVGPRPISQDWGILLLDNLEKVIKHTRCSETLKDKKKLKVILKTNKLEGGASFHEKAKKNTKVNLGGPSKTKKKTGTSVNRNILKTRAAKRKKK